MSDPVLDHARRSIATGSKSFALASRLLTREMRRDCVLLYAWCRHADDVIDGQASGHSPAAATRPPEEARARLQELRRRTHQALEGAKTETVYGGLARVVNSRRIPRRHVDELLDGFRMDVEARRYRDMSDVLDYCYHVAGVVGVMMARIMGVRDPEVLDRASDLGIAFQLTNIARDVVDDARIGRVYLPRSLLRAEGLDGVDPDDPGQRAALHRAALRLLDLSEAYYDSATAGVAALPRRPAFAIAAAQGIYRRIGVKLRGQGPGAWEGRLSTTRAEKLRLVAKAAGNTLLAPRRPVPDVSRDGLYRRPG